MRFLDVNIYFAGINILVHIEYVSWNIIHLGIWNISLSRNPSPFVIYRGLRNIFAT
jgi:hypothetical protein